MEVCVCVIPVGIIGGILARCTRRVGGEMILGGRMMLLNVGAAIVQYCIICAMCLDVEVTISIIINLGFEHFHVIKVIIHIFVNVLITTTNWCYCQ